MAPASSFFEPLYSLSKYTGLFPFNEDLQLSERLWKISIISLVIVEFVFLGTKLMLRVDGILQIPLSLPFTSITTVLAVVDSLVVISHTMSMVRYKDKMVTLGRTLTTMNKGKKFKLSVPKKYTVLGSLLLLATVVIINAVDGTIGELLVHSKSELHTYIIVMIFCTFLQMYQHHFEEYINNLNINSLEETTKKSLGLITGCENISEMYGMQMLFLSLKTLLILVVMGNSIAVDLKNCGKVPITLCVGKFISKSMVLGDQFFIIIMATSSCRAIETSVERFKTLVFREMRRSQELLNNDVLKVYVMKNPTVRFSACGFFSFGQPLVTSIFAAAVTYVVIFVQFNEPQR